jgi:hypothetical protein
VAHGKKTGADKTQDRGKQQRNAIAKDAGPSAAAWPERSKHGPSAAAWPERREMARAPRHGPSAARAAEARARRIAVEAETRASPGHRPRPCANWLKTLVRKFEKLSYWNKTEISDVLKQNVNVNVVLCSIL